MTIILVIFGMSLALSCVGLHTDMPSAMIKGGSGIISSFFVGIFNAIAWIVIHTWRAMTRVYDNLRKAGYNWFISVLGAIVTLVIII